MQDDIYGSTCFLQILVKHFKEELNGVAEIFLKFQSTPKAPQDDIPNLKPVHSVVEHTGETFKRLQQELIVFMSGGKKEKKNSVFLSQLFQIDKEHPWSSCHGV